MVFTRQRRGASFPVQETPDVEPDIAHLLNEVGDDRDTIQPGDRVLLIVENDLAFARFLLDTAREKGFKGLVTSLGAAALALTREYKPDAITLDIYLPDIEGWRILERLKNDIGTRHIPVCVISTDESRDRALASGALAFVAKPIQNRDMLDGLLEHVRDFTDRAMKSLLVVEPDVERRSHILDSIDAEDIQVTAVPDALQPSRCCASAGSTVCWSGPTRIACPTSSWRPASCPTAASAGCRYSSTAMTTAPATRPLGNGWPTPAPCGESAPRSACSIRPLSSCTGPSPSCPEGKRQLLLDLHQSDKLLAGKKVLIVDDDMRNIFALSTVLEEHEMTIARPTTAATPFDILRTSPTSTSC